MAALVVYDLQTTGLEPDCHITQVAAKCRGKEFNEYVKPQRNVMTRATALNGMVWDGVRLTVWDREVPAASWKQVLARFIAFLKQCSRDAANGDGDGPGVILVGHYGIDFDADRLLKSAQNAGMRDELDEVCQGFADSIKAIRVVHPRLASYKLVNLTKRFLGARADSYDALDFTRALNSLLKVLEISDGSVINGAVESHQIVPPY